MTKKQFKSLSRGDIVRHKRGLSSFVVDKNFGADHVTALLSVELTNPDEWDLLFKAKQVRVKQPKP